MATMPGKTDRYRPNDPSWLSAPFYGGFMPSIVPDQTVAKSPYYPNSVVNNTFAALGPLENRPVGGGSGPVELTVTGGTKSWPKWTSLARADRFNGVQPKYDIPGYYTRPGQAVATGAPASVGPTLDDLLAYAKGLPDEPAVNPAVAAATSAGNPVNNVTAAIKPQSRGGLFELIFGPSKNGMGGLAGLLGGPGAGGIVGMLGAPSTPRAPRTARAPDTYTPATSVSGNTGYRNERTGVLHTSDKGHQYGSTSSGQRTDYGASPGQKTAGLKPGDRVYDSSTNSWGLK